MLRYCEGGKAVKGGMDTGDSCVQVVSARSGSRFGAVCEVGVGRYVGAVRPAQPALRMLVV